jgi:parallel beta-helix repeat protein
MVIMDGNDCIFQNNTAEWANAAALGSFGNNNTYSNNIIQNNGQMGLNGAGNNSLYTDNHSLGNNWKGYDSSQEAGGGKWSNVLNNTVTRHEAGNNNGPGIWFDVHDTNNTISSCLVYNNTGHGIHVELHGASNVVENCVVFGTRFHPTYATTEGNGITFTDSSDNVAVNNTIFNCAGVGMFIRWDGRDSSVITTNNKVYNNIVAFNALSNVANFNYQTYFNGKTQADAQGNKHDGNVYSRGSGPGTTFRLQNQAGTDTLSTWQANSLGDTNAIKADPLLMDASQYSGFHLTSSSPAIGNGVTPPVTVSVDYDGDPRPSTGADSGADQFTPAAPTGLTATPGNAQVVLNWSAAAGANSYNVKRSTTSGGPYSTIANVTTTGYTNTGLINGTTYYFVVSAKVTSGGESPNSSQASATPVAPPAAPTGLSATPGNAQVSLTWSTDSGATSYNVKRATVSGGPYTTITNLSATSFLDTGVANGTTYYYVVSGLNAGGESSNSSQVSATPVAPPAAPTGLVATAGNAQVSLTWNTDSGATSYNVKRATVNGGPYTTITNITITGFIDTGLNNGTTYYYVVSGLNAGGEGPNSGQASATPFAQPPAPTGLSATPGNDQVSLAWNAASGATSYNVKESTTSGGPYTTLTNIAGTSFVVTGLINGTNYYFVVSALNGGGESPNSSQASATPGSGSIPVYRVNTGGSASGSFATDAYFSGGTQFSVTNVVDISGLVNPAPMAVYQSYRYIKTNGNTLTYSMTNLTAGLDYRVRLHFADLFNTLPGQRQFDVDINGTRVLTNFDIIATAGAPFKGVIEEFTAFADTSGNIAVVFTATTLDSACINGIEILSAFESQDIGPVAAVGSASITNQVYTVNGSGVDINNSNDQFQFVYRSWTGDVELVARVLSISNTDGHAKAGVMIRGSLADNSAHALSAVQPANGIQFVRRDTNGGSTTTTLASNLFAPYWVKLVRSQNLVSSYQSSDGTNWIWIGSDTVSLAAAVDVGLVVCSHTNGVICTATFDNVSASDPWISDDVGVVGVAGSAVYSPLSGLFTVLGSGTNIFGTADSFQFVNQPFYTNGQIVVLVASEQNVDPWAKAGVMIRQSLSADSIHAVIDVTPGNGIEFNRRLTTGGTTSHTVTNGFAAPYWLMLSRSNSLFTASRSADGLSWVTVGSDTITMTNPVFVGLIVCSHTNVVTCTSTFTNVTVTPSQ